MPALDIDIIERMAERLSEIDEFLRENHATLESQKHLELFSAERAYWHAGYASALKDILKALQGTRSPFN